MNRIHFLRSGVSAYNTEASAAPSPKKATPISRKATEAFSNISKSREEHLEKLLTLRENVVQLSRQYQSTKTEVKKFTLEQLNKPEFAAWKDRPTSLREAFQNKKNSVRQFNELKEKKAECEKIKQAFNAKVEEYIELDREQQIGERKQRKVVLQQEASQSGLKLQFPKTSALIKQINTTNKALEKLKTFDPYDSEAEAPDFFNPLRALNLSLRDGKEQPLRLKVLSQNHKFRVSIDKW